MAITVTWVLSMVVINHPRTEARVTGIRTEVDDVDSANNREDTYNTSGHYGTGPQKSKIADALRAKHVSKLLKETNQSTAVATLIATGEAAMNQWEIDNG